MNSVRAVFTCVGQDLNRVQFSIVFRNTIYILVHIYSVYKNELIIVFFKSIA